MLNSLSNISSGIVEFTEYSNEKLIYDINNLKNKEIPKLREEKDKL